MKVSLRKIIILTISAILVAVLAAAWYIDHKKTVFISELDTKLLETKGELLSIVSAEPAALAQDKTAGAVHDCGKRSQYIDYLSRLNTLSGGDLVTAQNLHMSCGLFRPTARAVKAVVLQETVARYSELVSLRLVLEPDSEQSYSLAKWLTIVEKEQEIADLLTQQSQLQLAIIDALIANNAAVVNETVSKAQEVNELLEVASITMQTEVDSLLGV